MKSITYFISLCILVLVSCESESTSNNNPTLSGNYRLTSLIADVAVDLNQDGATNTQVMNETTCFDTVAINFSNNTNFNASYSEVGFDVNNVLTCATNMQSGTYTYSNGVLSITVPVNGGTVTESHNVLLTPTTLEFTVTDADVANYFSGAPGTPAANITQLDVVYTKI